MPIYIYVADYNKIVHTSPALSIIKVSLFGGRLRDPQFCVCVWRGDSGTESSRQISSSQRKKGWHSRSENESTWSPVEPPQRGKGTHRRGLPDLHSLLWELGTFPGLSPPFSFPWLVLTSTGCLDNACPQAVGKGIGKAGWQARGRGEQQAKVPSPASPGSAPTVGWCTC